MPIHSHLTPRKVVTILGLLSVLLLMVGIASVLLGASSISIAESLRSVFGAGVSEDDPTRLIILQIRLPRVLLAAIIGAGLAIAGATFQALLRNPLAEPYILGVSSGGTVGAVAVMMLGLGSSYLTVPLFSFIGSGLVMMLVYTLGHRRGFLDTNALLLSGVMVGAFFSAIVLLITALVNQDMRTAYLWLIGNLSGADMKSFYTITPLILFGSIGLLVQGRYFNFIATGEETALHLGVEVERVKKISYALASLITGLAVSVSGVIGFVGLIVPHVCRLIFGPDHRLLLPASLIAGASFLILCDLLSRTLLAPIELPVGVVTAVLGAPVFIYLLKKK
ncbi:MAG: iron ABC transporter permease [bacterium]